MNFAIFLAAFAVAGIFSIYTRYYKHHLYKFAKPVPLALLLLLSLVMLNSGPQGQTLWLIIAGLALGLLGDILLLKENLFLGGLISFLAGHIAYMVYFALSAGQIHEMRILVIAAVALSYGTFVARSAQKNGKPKYVIPILLYVTTIAAMFYYGSLMNLVVASGVTLFVISDAVLGYDRFVKKFSIAQLIILSTYYIGQFLIFFGTFIAPAQ